MNPISYRIHVEDDLKEHQDHEVNLKLHFATSVKKSDAIQFILENIPAILEEVYSDNKKSAKAVSHKARGGF